MAHLLYLRQAFQMLKLLLKMIAIVQSASPHISK